MNKKSLEKQSHPVSNSKGLAFLEKKAQKIEEAVEKYFVGPHGVVYSFLDKTTRLPPTEALFAEAKPEIRIPGISASDFWMHENCGMCTGAYMQAMILKYRCTKNPTALLQARRCLEALKYIYEMGKELETGFFPKIYGGKFSTQTSTDQVLYAVCAMDSFYDLADSDEKKSIQEMIPSMIDFWAKRHYRLTYYHVKDMLWPLDRFPSLLALARKYSDREIFKTEYERLLPLTEHTDCSRLGLKLAGKIEPTELEKQTHCWLICHSADAMTMSTMQYDILLKNAPDNPMREKWLAALRQMWDESKLTLAENGRYYTQALIDMDNMKMKRTPSYLDGDSELYGAESAWSTMLVRGGLQALPYLPEQHDEIIQKTVRVLSQLVDIDDFTYYDEPERFKPESRFKTKLLSGDAITNWLWAYWEGAAKYGTNWVDRFNKE